MSQSGEHFRTCPLCEAMCGLRIEVEGPRIVSIRGDEDDPFSRGHICPKAAALADLQADPDRLRTPMRRRGAPHSRDAAGSRGGPLVPCSFDDAFAEVASRLHAIQRRHGRNAVAVYVGNPAVHNLGALLYGPELLRGLRTKNRFSATSLDQLPHMLAAFLMFGHQLLLPVPDVDRTGYVLVLGGNPLASNGSLMTAPGMKKRLEAVRARGGKVVVVDPRRTETAERADRHLFIRPGTDAFLLLALTQQVFARGAARLGHLAPIVRGLEALRDAAAPFTPARAAAATGVPAASIEALAGELLAAERAVVYGRVGACTQAFGGLCAWLINALNLLTGNFDRPGGVMFTLPAIDVVRAPGGLGVSKGGFGRWRSRVRGLPEFGGELPTATLADEILTEGEGQVRALLTIGGNPVLSSPNGRRLDRALESLEFMACVDPYLNETTRHADVILPPTSALEHAHYDLVFHALAVRNTAKFAPALFRPPEGALDDGAILARLLEALEAERHGPLSRAALRAKALRHLGPERLLDLGLRLGPYRGARGPGGRSLTLKRLRESPHGVDLGPLEPCMPGRLPRGHEHIDLAPAPMLEDLARLEAAEHVERAGLRLIGRRQLRSNNSWLHNAPSLMRGGDRCTLLVHPEDAARLALTSGGEATVRSRVGEVKAKVEVTDAIMPGVVSLPHGFGHDRPGARLRVAAVKPGASINDLTDEARIDALTGNAAFSGVPVEVQPA
jgi:anaerobic selenocysteine-containing dehydrogenase